MEVAQQSVEIMAETMKRQSQEKLESLKAEKQPQARPVRVAAPKPKASAPRKVSAEVVIRKAIRDHERKIKALTRALSALGE